MPYTTIVAGTTITASWANANVRDQTVPPFASTAARDSAITTPVSGMLAAITGAPKQLTHYNGSVWVCLTQIGARVDTTETTTSAAYADVATVGPVVTIVTGTRAIVSISLGMFNSTGGGGQAIFAGFAVSGATTIAAGDTTAIGFVSEVGGHGINTGRTVNVTSLNNGSNTFTMKYKTTGGTLSVYNRDITVVGCP